MSERIILHADMDAFFASIEERDHPELRGRAVIVGAVSPRGVVAAASYEARKFGVRSAMPGFRARELCPHGVFLPSDIQKYARVSAQVHAVFEEFTPLIEPLALDEAFLDISGSLGLYGGARELARRLKERVREETELIVSCGIGPNKLIAKIACSLGKPDGLYSVSAADSGGFLDALPLRRLFGVGPVSEHALLSAGFSTLGDIARADRRALQAVVGDRAEALIRLARGEDDRPVEAGREAKSYGEENTFEEDQRGGSVVTQALTAHAHAVARRLRSDGVAGRTITLKVRLARRDGHSRDRNSQTLDSPRYPLRTRSRSLTDPTDDAALIRKIALELWESAQFGSVRLVGISVSQLSSVAANQLDLFAADGGGRSAKLGPALDAIRARFGEQAIHVATRQPDKITPSSRKKRGA
ncbi:MAG TPA: DNA polymerase IV [Polyangiales bacterium]